MLNQKPARAIEQITMKVVEVHIIKMLSANRILIIFSVMMAEVMAQNPSSIDFLKPKVCLEPSENYFCYGGFVSSKFDGPKNGTAGQCEFPVTTSCAMSNSYPISYHILF